MIKYCDFLNGSDSTGDGSYGNPYKTITTASVGLTGGDEVRVAKSPDNTALAGTISFTRNDVSITGSGTLFTTQLAIGDFLQGGDGLWYEVVTISSDTAASLYRVYTGATQSGVSSQKMGEINTGIAAFSEVVQTVSSSGLSEESLLIISGGWDLSTQTQTGVSYFKQIQATFNNRYGSALTCVDKSYVSISKVGFFRYRTGISVSGVGTCITISECFLSGTSYTGLLIYGPSKCLINSCFFVANSTGLSGSSSALYSVSNCTFNGNFSNGFSFISLYKSTISNCTAEINASGFNISGADNIIDSCISNDNVQFGFNLGASVSASLKDCTSSGNGTAGAQAAGGDIYLSNCSLTESSEVFIPTDYSNVRIYSKKHDQTADNNWIFTDGGTVNSLTNDRPGGAGFKWKIAVSSSHRNADYPINLLLMEIPVEANLLVTVACFVKKDHATDVVGRLVCKGAQINGVASDVIATKANDLNWELLTISFTPTEKGVVEIKGVAEYSTGNSSVYFADVTVTQE